MVNQKFSPEVYGQIDPFLSSGWSLSVIRKHFSGHGLYISKRQLSKIKNRSKENGQPHPASSKPGPKSSLDARELSHLRRMVSKPDPAVLKEMANQLGVSERERVTQYALSKKLGAKLVKKPKGHFLNDEKKEKRRVQA